MLNTLQEYHEAITELYNEHKEAYEHATLHGSTAEQAYHAFVCNAINDAVNAGTKKELKTYFAEYAI